MTSKFLVSIILVLSAVSASAITSCPESPILGVKVSDSNVVTKQGSHWHLVSTFTDDSAIREKLSLLLTAQASGKDVVLDFDKDNYDCTNQTYSSRVYQVQILN